MKKNWPMLVVLGLAGTACDSLLDPTVFHGAVDPECAGKLEGTPLAVQTPGDCVVQVCDGHGHARVDLSPEDVADDGNPCTKDECKNQEAVHATLNGSMAAEQVVGDCLVKQCNAEGVVVEVPDDTDTGETLECRAVSCENGVKVATNAQSGASCEGGASECNSDGLCVNWCNGDVGFRGRRCNTLGLTTMGQPRVISTTMAVGFGFRGLQWKYISGHARPWVWEIRYTRGVRLGVVGNLRRPCRS
jgi:hypothetical protein